jgi:hypothetical protein
VLRTRTEDLSGSQRISGVGSYFQLAGYARVVDQVLQALWALEGGFIFEDDFVRGLQLLRLVAAPGMGKVSAADPDPDCTPVLTGTPAPLEDGASLQPACEAAP